MSYTTNYLVNSTDLGTIFAPDFSTYLEGSTDSVSAQWYDTTTNFTVSTTGMYMITFYVTTTNGNASTTSMSYGLFETQSSTFAFVCLVPAFIGDSGSANGPYWSTTYVSLTADTEYSFCMIIYGSDVTDATSYRVYRNFIPS